MPGEARKGQFEPSTPAVDGRPPNFIVGCNLCRFRIDAHADSAEAAIEAVTLIHGHSSLTATAVDYTTGYGETKDQPHPLYQGDSHAHA